MSLFSKNFSKKILQYKFSTFQGHNREIDFLEHVVPKMGEITIPKMLSGQRFDEKHRLDGSFFSFVQQGNPVVLNCTLSSIGSFRIQENQTQSANVFLFSLRSHGIRGKFLDSSYF